MKKRRYTREFKLSVLAELSDKTVAQVSKKHNIHHSLISRWRNEYRESPSKAFSENGNLWKESAELEKYKKLVGELYAENEFLKKAQQRLKQLRMEEENMRRIK